MYMKTIKKWSGILLSAVMLMSLLAIPGVLAEETPIQITGLDQLQTIESGSYQLAADLTIPENAILTVPSDVTITLDLNGHTDFETDRYRTHSKQHGYHDHQRFERRQDWARHRVSEHHRQFRYHGDQRRHL